MPMVHCPPIGNLSRLIDLMSQVEMLSALEERPNLFQWPAHELSTP